MLPLEAAADGVQSLTWEQMNEIEQAAREAGIPLGALSREEGIAMIIAFGSFAAYLLRKYKITQDDINQFTTKGE